MRVLEVDDSSVSRAIPGRLVRRLPCVLWPAGWGSGVPSEAFTSCSARDSRVVSVAGTLSEASSMRRGAAKGSKVQLNVSRETQIDLRTGPSCL